MTRITGWKGKLRPVGAWYPYYRDRRNPSVSVSGIRWRNTNTGEVANSKRIRGRLVPNTIIRQDANYGHISGDESNRRYRIRKPKLRKRALILRI